MPFPPLAEGLSPLVAIATMASPIVGIFIDETARFYPGLRRQVGTFVLVGANAGLYTDCSEADRLADLIVAEGSEPDPVTVGMSGNSLVLLRWYDQDLATYVEQQLTPATPSITFGGGHGSNVWSSFSVHRAF